MASWDAGFAKYSDGSLEDLRLHAAGLWFGDVFRCMREEFERLRAPGEPVELYQRRAIGLVNRECQRATTSAEAQDVAGTDEFAMHELVQQEVEFGGAMVKPAEILEGVVDALRLELSSERPMNEEKRQIAKGVPDARLEYTMERFWRMRAYDGMRHLWDQCRWHCWYVEFGVHFDVVQPSERSLEDARAVSFYRWNLHQTEDVVIAFATWADMEASERASVGSQPRVTGVARRGKRLAVEVNLGDVQTEHPPDTWIARQAACGSYMEEFLDEPLPKWPGLTIRILFNVWEVLAPLADVLAKRAALSEPATETVRVLEAYAPVLRRSELLQALHAALRLPTKVVELALDRFIWTQSSAHSLWVAPFVPVGSGLCVVNAGLACPNLARCAEHWLKEGGAAMERRGPMFEEYVRGHLERALRRRTQPFEHARVVPHAVSLGDNRIGDLDLVLWVGNRVLVGELKAQVFPATPLEEHNYFDRLEEAGEQLARKRHLIEDFPSTLLERLGRLGHDGRPMELSWVIVANTPIGTLRTFQGFPVVDVHILRRYLEEGFSDQFVTLDRAGFGLGERTQFYANEQEAAERLDEYLVRPPHLELLRHYVSRADAPVPTAPGVARHSFARLAVKLPSLEERFAAALEMGVPSRIGAVP